jgi:hypothetical protein
MLRPTPGRLIYLLVGLVIGLAALFLYSSVAGFPAYGPFTRATAATSQLKAPTEFSGASLSRSVTANQTATKNAVVLRVNTLEEYGDGFSLTYSLISGQPGEAAPVLQPDRFDVTDDKGGSYHLSTAQSSGNVGAGMSTGYLTFTPAPNADARTLIVSVPHLIAVGAIAETNATKILDGPWQVQIPLR